MSTIANFSSNLVLLPKKYIGIDLHSNTAVVCIIQTAIRGQKSYGKVIFRRKFNVSSPEKVEEFFDELRPYCENQEHHAVVESTYNWYWMADGFEKRGWNLDLADPCTVAQAQIKYSDDDTDAHYLAERLRLNSLKTASILPSEIRALRDLCRYRGKLVRERARHKITLVNLFTNQLSIRINSNSLLKEARNFVNEGHSITAFFEKFFTNANICLRLKLICLQVWQLDELIAEADATIRKQLSIHLAYIRQPRRLKKYNEILQSIKGCGDVLASVISLEVGDIKRFSSAKNFVSYCRLAPTARLSNGKSKGLGNAKNGSAYLSWAMTELANLVVRYNVRAKKLFDRLFNRSRLRVKAIRSLAAKIARSIYYMLRDNVRFNNEKCFG